MNEMFSVFASEMILFGQYIEARRNVNEETKRIFAGSIPSWDRAIELQYKNLEKIQMVSSAVDLDHALFAFKVANINLGFFAKTLGWYSERTR